MQGHSLFLIEPGLLPVLHVALNGADSQQDDDSRTCPSLLSVGERVQHCGVICPRLLPAYTEIR